MSREHYGGHDRGGRSHGSHRYSSASVGGGNRSPYASENDYSYDRSPSNRQQYNQQPPPPRPGNHYQDEYRLVTPPRRSPQNEYGGASSYGRGGGGGPHADPYRRPTDHHPHQLEPIPPPSFEERPNPRGGDRSDHRPTYHDTQPRHDLRPQQRPQRPFRRGPSEREPYQQPPDPYCGGRPHHAPPHLVPPSPRDPPSSLPPANVSPRSNNNSNNPPPPIRHIYAEDRQEHESDLDGGGGDSRGGRRSNPRESKRDKRRDRRKDKKDDRDERGADDGKGMAGRSSSAKKHRRQRSSGDADSKRVDERRRRRKSSDDRKRRRRKGGLSKSTWITIAVSVVIVVGSAVAGVLYYMRTKSDNNSSSNVGTNQLATNGKGGNKNSDEGGSKDAVDERGESPKRSQRPTLNPTPYPTRRRGTQYPTARPTSRPSRALPTASFLECPTIQTVLGNCGTSAPTTGDDVLPPVNPGSCNSNTLGEQIFINEIHYSNLGFDFAEFIEVVFTTSLDVSEYRVDLYNGVDGRVYRSTHLADPPAVSSTELNGLLTFAAYSQVNFQNGPAGIALVGPNGVAEFISYGGAEFVATDGGAAGVRSADMGVVEPESSPLTSSLQRRGVGRRRRNFQWSEPRLGTPGRINDGQVFSC